MADRSFTLGEEDLSPRFASAVRAQTRGMDLYLAMGPDRRVRVLVGPRAFAEAIEQWIEIHSQEVVVTVDDFEAVAHLRYGAANRVPGRSAEAAG